MLEKFYVSLPLEIDVDRESVRKNLNPSLRYRL